jgi:hypothetical protein
MAYRSWLFCLGIRVNQIAGLIFVRPDPRVLLLLLLGAKSMDCSDNTGSLGMGTGKAEPQQVTVSVHGRRSALRPAARDSFLQVVAGKLFSETRP